MFPMTWTLSALSDSVFQQWSQTAARAPGITFSNVTQTERRQEETKGLSSHASGLLMGWDNFSQKSSSHLSPPSIGLNWIIWPLLAIEEAGKVNAWSFSVSVVGRWQGKSELRKTLGSHSIMSCFGNSVLKNWRSCPKVFFFFSVNLENATRMWRKVS